MTQKFTVFIVQLSNFVQNTLKQEKLQEMIWFEIIFILKQIFVIYVLKCSCQNDKIWLISC